MSFLNYAPVVMIHTPNYRYGRIDFICAVCLLHYQIMVNIKQAT